MRKASQPPKDRSTYHHGALRSTLVETAARLIESDGIAALSLRRVAREAGVSHAAPYRHFRDKHELQEAVAAAGFRALEARLDTIAIRYPDDAHRQLVEACRAYVAETLARPGRAHLMFGGALDASRRSAELTDAITSSFAKMVETVRRGEGSLYRDLPTRELVLSLWSTTHGLALLASAGQLQDLDPVGDPEALAERLVENLLCGLARSAG